MEMQALVSGLVDKALSNRGLVKDDTVDTSMGGGVQLMHGTGGLFTDACRERQVINAVLAPTGIDFPTFGTTNESPIFSTLTGYSEATGTEPTEPCEAGPIPGTMTVCDISFPLGRKAYSSDTIDVDEVIMNACRGDTRDMMLLGGLDQMPMALDPRGITDQDKSAILNFTVKQQMYGVGRAYQRFVGQQKWTGDPSSSPTAGYHEFRGLDLMIATGYQDVNTTTACPELDSDVKDFEGECLTSSTTHNIHTYMSALEATLYFRAMRAGLLPVQWAWVMTPQVWHELTIVWPLMRQVEVAIRASVPTGAQLNVDASSTQDMTNAMRNGMSIVVNGRQYPVFVDDGIPVDTTTAPATAATPMSSIYFVPMTILGGTPVTYWEHKDYRAIGQELTAPLTQMLRFWTDDGRYLWTVDQRLWCFRVHAKMEARLIMRTPQLAGRIDNVLICPLQLFDSIY